VMPTKRDSDVLWNIFFPLKRWHLASLADF
jgi:hypothetical protein